jgi:hypothetical protein
MFETKENLVEADGSRRKIFAVVALITVIVVGGAVYLFLRHASSIPGGQARLEGALRPGMPEFDQYRDRIFIDFNPDENATESTRPLGDIVMTIRPTVRNFTGRTITGLELRATVVDLAGQPVKERTVVPIPGRQAELEPNKTMQVTILMEGFKKEDERANIHIEVTGMKFKQ